MALLQFSINNFNCSSALNFANHFISPTRSRHVFQYRKKKQTNSSLATAITRCSSTSSSSSSVVISSLTSFILEQKQQTSDIDDNHSDELLQQDHDDELIVSREQAEEEDTEEEDEEHDSDGDEEVDDEEVEFVEEKRAVHEVWKQLQGCNDWEGLLDPMNSHMRNEILRYGELAQACYDSFDFDPHSKYCGTCKYTGAHFFEYLDMFDKGYHISRYLYATSNINLPNFFQKSKLSSVWSTHANWMGYVAVITDEKEIKRLGRRDILVAWRGTVTYIEWIYDLKDILCSANFGDDPSVKLELGFYDLYTKKEENCNYASFSAREQVLAEIKRLVERYKGEELSITFTGHSLGAALAILSAYDIAEMGLNVKSDGTAIPVSVFSFAGPRVGNLRFKERCDELGVKVLRVTNVHDKVPTVPGVLANEKFQYQKYLEEKLSFPWSYAHVGVELALDHTHSPFLKPTNDLVCAHNLEAHLHLVDGYHGKGRKFRLVSKRDVALVNKSCDFLKTKYNVPPFWKQDENKGMVKNSEGRWIMPERPRIDAHPPDTAHHLEQVLKRITSVASGENAGITSKQAF